MDKVTVIDGLPRSITIDGLGHQLEWDPPLLPWSKVRRWTCTVCGRAILCYLTNWYGSAFKERCQEAEKLGVS